METFFYITMSFLFVVYALYAVSSIKEYGEIRKMLTELKKFDAITLKRKEDNEDKD